MTTPSRPKCVVCGKDAVYVGFTIVSHVFRESDRKMAAACEAHANECDDGGYWVTGTVRRLT